MTLDNRCNPDGMFVCESLDCTQLAEVCLWDDARGHAHVFCQSCRDDFLTCSNCGTELEGAQRGKGQCGPCLVPWKYEDEEDEEEEVEDVAIDEEQGRLTDFGRSSA